MIKDVREFKVGTTVWAVRGGHAKTSDPLPHVVVAIGRRYVTLQKSGTEVTEKFCPVRGLTEKTIRSGYIPNSSWKFFNSVEDIEEDRRIQNRKSKAVAIAKKLPHSALSPKFVDDFLELAEKHGI